MSYYFLDFLNLCNKNTSPRTLIATSIGLVLPWVHRSDQQPKSLYWHVTRLTQAAINGQIALTFDRFGQLCGFVQWACLSSEVSSRILKNGTSTLLPSEMQSGTDVWIVDIFVHHGEATQVIADLRDYWLAEANCVTYFRYKRGRRIAKRVARSDKTSFFNRPAPPFQEKQRFLETKDGEGLRESASSALDAALELGEVAQLASQVASIGELPLPMALARLRAPINHLQRKAYRDSAGSLSGFMSWGWLDMPSLKSTVPAPHHLESFQLNEGTSLVLCDAFGTDDGIAQISDDLACGFIPGEQLIIRTERIDGTPDIANEISASDITVLRALKPSHQQVIDAVQKLSAARGQSTELKPSLLKYPL